MQFNRGRLLAIRFLSSCKGRQVVQQWGARERGWENSNSSQRKRRKIDKGLNVRQTLLPAQCYCMASLPCACPGAVGGYSQCLLSPLGAVRQGGQWAEGAQVTFQESGSGEGGGKVEGGLALRDTAFSWYTHWTEERLQADKNTAVAEQLRTNVDSLVYASNAQISHMSK